MTKANQGIEFFVDRCLGRYVAKQLKKSGWIVHYHDDCGFPQDAKDVDWIPVTGKKQWVVLSKDARIIRNQRERRALANANLYFFALTARSLTGEAMGKAMVKATTEIVEIIHSQPSPLIGKIDRNGAVTISHDCKKLEKEFP